jgi:hypothetical protein
LLSSGAAQQYTGKEPVGFTVLRLAVGESREATKPPPICGTGIPLVSLCQTLGYEGREMLRIHVIVLEPRLEVGCASLYDGAWLIAVRQHPVERALSEIVEDGEAVLSGREDVNVGSMCVMPLEQRNAGYDLRT